MSGEVGVHCFGDTCNPEQPLYLPSWSFSQSMALKEDGICGPGVVAFRHPGSDDLVPIWYSLCQHILHPVASSTGIPGFQQQNVASPSHRPVTSALHGMSQCVTLSGVQVSEVDHCAKRTLPFFTTQPGTMPSPSLLLVLKVSVRPGMH